MKIHLFLFFSFVTPLTLFLAIVVYGGITTGDMKDSLAKSGVYEQIASRFTLQNEATDINGRYNFFVSKRMTPEYIKLKSEAAIDASAYWISGKTASPPVISLKEIKDEVAAEYPELLRTLEYIPTHSELQNTDLSEKQQEHYLEQRKKINAFVKSDFTFPLREQLEGIKFVYTILQGAVPILVLLLLFSLVLLVKLAHPFSLKLRWLGASLLASGLIGYGLLFLTPYFSDILFQSRLLQESDFFSLFSPIIKAILDHYAVVYIGYQQLLSSILLTIGAVCIAGAILTRKNIPPPTKWVYKARSYWETT